jgi:hypothetical protein
MQDYKVAITFDLELESVDHGLESLIVKVLRVPLRDLVELKLSAKLHLI